MVTILTYQTMLSHIQLILAILIIGLSGSLSAKKAPEIYGPEPTLKNVPYGKHGKHVLDFWKADSKTPTPVAFYIHGGAWKGRDKIDARSLLNIEALLKAEVSVVAISYRLLKDAEDIEPFVKVPMQDAARALQLVRSKAEEWNIDRKRIGVSGASAGGCTALWLAYHDEMADPASSDPIARESTRVACVVVDQAQTSLDPKQVREWMPKASYGAHAFNMDSFDQYLEEREKILPWIQTYSPYALASKDDPPTILIYGRMRKIPDDIAHAVHSSAYGIGLKQHCDELEMSCKIIIDRKRRGKVYTAISDNLIRLLKNEKSPHGHRLSGDR